MTRALWVEVADDPRRYAVFATAGTPSAPLVLDLIGDDGREAIPDAAVSTPFACRDTETCRFVALPPRASERPTHLSLRAPTLDVERRVALEPMSLAGAAIAVAPARGNRAVELVVLDPLVELARLDIRIRRGFEVATRPGPCRSDEAPAFRALSATTSRHRLPADLDQAPERELCVRVRPAAPPGGAALAEASVPAAATVARYRQTYIPAVTSAPLVVLPVLDLNLPSETRCNAAEAFFTEAIATAAAKAAAAVEDPPPVRILPALVPRGADGARCAPVERPFEVGLAVARLTEAAAELGPGPLRATLVGVTNYGPGFGWASALVDLAGLGPTLAFEIDTVLVSPETGGFANLALPIGSAEDPGYRDALVGGLAARWPYRSVEADPGTVVRLRTPGAPGAAAWLKICSSSHPVTPTGGPSAENPAIHAIGPEGPAVAIDLPAPRLVPASAVVVPELSIVWEACYADCDRPVGGLGRGSWRGDAACW